MSENPVNVLVVGMGTFGRTMCMELYDRGARVHGLDSSEDALNEIDDYLTAAYAGNAMVKEAYNAVTADSIDYAVVAIGESVEASLVATLILQEIGIARIFARAINDRHKLVLQRLGIGNDRIIQVERDAGAKWATTIVQSGLERLAELGDQFDFVSVVAPDWTVGTRLADLELRTRFSMNVVVIRRMQEIATEQGVVVTRPRIILPQADTEIQPGDTLFVVSPRNKLQAFLEKAR